jgi:exo-beta-1,3-glucanase (GH17 family)
MAMLYEQPEPETAVLSDETQARYKNPGVSRKISLNFSPYYENGASPGSAVSDEALRRLLNSVAPFCDTIRTFSAAEYESLYAIGKREYNMRIIAGAWLSGSAETDKTELDALIRLADAGLADLLLVGSEGIYRGDYSAEYALQCIAYVRKSLADKAIPVSTSDTAGVWLEDASLINSVDFLCYTYYPYFEGIPANKGVKAFEETYGKLKKRANGKPVICSETAFPDGGEKMGGAVPSPENSVKYFSDVYDWSVKAQAEVIFFEAVNEAWKGSPDSVETHWGICDNFGSVKYQYWEKLLEIIKQEVSKNGKQ